MCYGDMCIECKKCKKFFEHKMTIKEAREIDESEIKYCLNKTNINAWKYDVVLNKWFYTPTGQTIKEYMLENITTILSPGQLEDYMEEEICKINFKEDFDNILEEMTNMQLLSSLTTKRDDYSIYIMGQKIKITPKQWRHMVNEATKRFIRGH